MLPFPVRQWTVGLPFPVIYVTLSSLSFRFPRITQVVARNSVGWDWRYLGFPTKRAVFVRLDRVLYAHQMTCLAIAA